VLWMAGGMAHTETFDPKAYTAFETGLSPNKVLSTFPSIDTVVDDIKLSKGLENVANLEKLSPSETILVVGLPKVKGSTGGPVRLIALV